MNVSDVFKFGMMTAALVLSTSASAGEAKLELRNPEKFTDIDSGNQGTKSMLRSISKSLGAEFSELAAKLPAGYQLDVTVTDLDLAGDVDPIPMRGMNEVRVLRDIDFPRMTFDYRLKDAAGAVRLEQSGVVVKDMQYLSHPKSTKSNVDSFYYERKMIRDWFNADLLPNVK
jgi:hypothetical protein